MIPPVKGIIIQIVYRDKVITRFSVGMTMFMSAMMDQAINTWPVIAVIIFLL